MPSGEAVYHSTGRDAACHVSADGASPVSTDGRTYADANPALSDFDRGIRCLEGHLVSTVAERPVGGSAATAEGKNRFARQIVLVAIGVHHFNNAVGIVYAQRTVLAHRNRDLCHGKLRRKWIAFKLSQNKQSCQYSVPSSEPAFDWLLATGHWLLATDYRHRSTASHHSIFNHSSKVAFAHSRFVHQASPKLFGPRAAATLNWYCGRRWRKISKARRV